MSIFIPAVVAGGKALAAVKEGVWGMAVVGGSGGNDAKTGVASYVYWADLNPSPSAPPGVEATVQTILSWLMWGGLVATIVGFIAAGISLAISNERGMGNENVKKLGFVCLGGMIVMGASALAKALVH